RTKLQSPPGDDGKGLDIPPDCRVQIDLLKELIWCYVIENPALASLQHGQRHAIRTLFRIFDDAVTNRNWTVFPPLFRDEAIELTKVIGPIPADRRARLVADTISAFTDEQALRMYQRLVGLSPGSALDPIAT